MKHLLLTAITFLSLNSFATGNGVERYVKPVDFTQAPEVPADVKVRVENLLARHCAQGVQEAAKLSVGRVEITSDKIDQGQVDYYYDVTVKLLSNTSDYKPRVRMKLVRWAMYVPENLELLSLASNYEDICR